MWFRVTVLSLFLATAMVPLGRAPVSAAAPVERVSGGSRVGTAAALAGSVYAAADAVVLARADQYADALSGAPLAAVVGGPVLLTASDRLSTETAEEIERLSPSRAYLLGGTAALSAQIEADLAALGIDRVTRVSGPSRFHTALEVAKLVGGSAVYVVQGNNADPAKGWPDAVSVSALAAFQKRPILLTERDFLPPASAQALAELDIQEAAIIGGTAAVSHEVEERVRQDAPNVYRLSGTSRYATAAAVARQSVNAGMGARRTWLATGLNYPDALAAGAAVAADEGVLLFVDGRSIHGSPEVVSWLETYRQSLERVRLVGGPQAISGDVQADVERVVSGLQPSPSPTPAPTPTPSPRPASPPPPAPPPPAEDCDASYPDVCIAPPPPDLDCGEIPYRRFRVLAPDPHDFDRDRDGVGCES